MVSPQTCGVAVVSPQTRGVLSHPSQPSHPINVAIASGERGDAMFALIQLGCILAILYDPKAPQTKMAVITIRELLYHVKRATTDDTFQTSIAYIELAFHQVTSRLAHY